MELTQLRYFLQVYRLGNICSASARLNVTQQAVSKQIRKLEDELGVALFLRNPRGVEATAYADMLAKKVQDFLPELDALVSDIQKRDTEIAGVVRLGIQCWQMSVAHGLKYEVLKAFEQAYPRVRLIWENSIPGRCLGGLREGAFDLVVMGGPGTSGGPGAYAAAPDRLVHAHGQRPSPGLAGCAAYKRPCRPADHPLRQ